MLNKAIVILGAGESQVLLIEKAKNLGLSTIVVDRNPIAPGFDIADVKINVSTYDANEIENQLKTIKDDFDITGIINGSSGPPVFTKGELSKGLKLQTYPPQIADIIIHKSKMVQFCYENDTLVPEMKIYEKGDVIDPREFSYPIIVKPSLSLIGKSGVYIVNSQKELHNKLIDAMSHSMDGRVNIEEYIEGDDVSFLSFVKNGDIKTSIIIDEINGINENGLHYGIGYAIPSKYSKSHVEDKIISLTQSLIIQFELNTTSFNFSCRVSKEGIPVLIEIHLEIGGDLVWDILIPESVNEDILSYGIGLLSGLQSPAPSFIIKPTAVIYNPGPGLITDKSYKLIRAANRKELEKKIHRYK